MCLANRNIFLASTALLANDEIANQVFPLRSIKNRSGKERGRKQNNLEGKEMRDVNGRNDNVERGRVTGV